MSKLPLACTLTLLLAACGGTPSTGSGGTPVTETSGTAPVSTAPGVVTPAPVSAAPVPTPTRRWSDPASWPSGKVPAAGDAVSLAAGTSLLLDVSPPRLASLSIPAGSALVFADASDLTLSTDWIMLEGTLAVGSEAQPYTHKATLLLTDATPGENVMGMGDRLIGVMGGTLELHGQKRLAWTRLAQTARAGVSTLTLQAAPDWHPGDLLGLASTDYDPAQSEQVVVKSVSGTTVTLALPLAYTHWGETESVGTQTVAEQAEVGLLSRNVLVEGGDDSVGSGLGGQVMVMAGSTAHIEGTEFTHMGQRNLLRRYPVHFHMMGPSAGSYLRGSSLHDLFNRCVTVHGSSDLSIEGNVAYGTTGHCFFMEDGSETGNTFLGNLAMRVRRPDSKLGETPLLTSDTSPAAFWITNPANRYVGNVSAGSDGTGFWYALPEHPTGLSAAAGAAVWPRHTPLGEFSGNTAHSGGRGLNVDNGNSTDGTNTEVTYYAPRQNPADPKSANVGAVYRNFSAYKNRERGVWLRGDSQTLQGGVLADNAVGATFASDRTGIDGTLLVGETANLGTPAGWEPKGAGGRSLPRPWDAAFPLRGFEFYDGTVSAQNVSVAHFFPTAQRGASGLGYNRQNAFAISPQNSASGVRWLDGSNRVLLEAPTQGKDGDSAATFLDRDGSVTGQAGRFVVAQNPLLTPGCAFQAAWNSSVCAGPFLRLWLNSVSGEKLGTVRVSGAGGEVALAGAPEDFMSYSTTLPVGGRYALAMPAAGHLRLGLDDVTPGQTLRLDLPYSGTPSLYRDWWIDSRNLLKKVSAASLDSTAGDSYALENGVLSVKLVVKPGQDYAELELCAAAGCK
ncbi:G8 domain-containing protein [Deinococcus sp.]|uniref:G8 domain-containing protein n=1 Tax=Deinococcus sp. TaxID=47478 RepID=UPI003C7B779B